MEIEAYARISVDLDEDRAENTSIANQKSIIAAYIADHFPDANVTWTEDRDRSGYTFAQREGYQTMRPRLMSGQSQTLIVKDFSRFSRRNSLGLLELETLRDAGVRIISIGDAVDYPTRDDWTLIQIKFLVNEMPVTETSRKIKAVIQNRQKDGRWVCAVPYGYRITNTKEMTYEIDPIAAQIVREIFDLYNSGWGYKRISNYLTDKGIPTPRANEIAWRESMGQHTKLKSKTEWSIISVSGILSNDFYIGTLRQRKYTRKGINGKDKLIDPEENIIIENAHEPIIDPATFYYTQDQLKRRSKSNYRGEKKYPTDYSGYLFCGDCGAPMFSMSRPDLAPAYTCGTYHRRGIKGCTSHHIRVDKLDELLKRYIQVVRDNSAAMLTQLEKAIQDQPDQEAQIGKTIDLLEKQLEDAKAQLKVLLKRKVIDTLGKEADEAAIIAETYDEMEKELTQRIKGLGEQIDENIDNRNHLLRANRAAKTVIDVFNSILAKKKLDKRDIGLIVDRIVVYEDTIEVKLKADIQGLIETGVWEDPENFDQGTEDISKAPIVQSSMHRRDKVFRVNVVSEGDPLEIFTDKDGGVVFKKYSLMGGVMDFAAQMCDTLAKLSGLIAVITDRDNCLAVTGAPRRELVERPISEDLERLMESRQLYVRQGDDAPVYVIQDAEKYRITVSAPILSGGDVLGAVMFVAAEDQTVSDTEVKMIQTAAGFLSRHMES